MDPILVTGSHGYIGTHLRPLLDPLPVATCDLKNGQDYRQLRDGRYSVVIHLAAFVSVVESFEKPSDYYSNNMDGVRDFLANNDIGKFIFISTGGAMYGNKRLAREEDAAYEHCLSPYAKSKLSAECIIANGRTKHTILRLANVFGGDYSVRGEASVHAHFANDNPIVLYGGKQTRDFIDVSSVCQAIHKAAFSNIIGTFNIGSGVETQVGDLATDFSVRRNVPLVLKGARPGEVDFISLDCFRARNAGLLK
jgi:UDP-glucose 4-epimerase